MCGIIGIISKKSTGFYNPEIELFREMLICNSIRGDDATGAFMVKKSGNVDFIKLATPPYNLIKSPEFKEFELELFRKGRCVIGHNRKSTEGDDTNENAHPFVSGNTILVHNGTLSNYRSLLSIKDREKFNVNVDSHAACILLDNNDPETILPQIHGAFVLVWYNIQDRKLYFIRNDERFLSFANTESNIYFASEPGLLKWLLDRRGLEIKPSISNFKSNILLSINIDDQPFQWKEQNIQLYKPAVRYDNFVSDKSIQKSTKYKPILDDIVESKRFNIHYGHNKFINNNKNDPEFQQIIWTIEDYKLIENTADQWLMWGSALDSDSIEIVTTFQGTEKEAEDLAYSTYAIGFIRRITNKQINGRSHQEIVVVAPREVELINMRNGITLTKEHFDYLISKNKCVCGLDCDTIDKEDLILTRQNLFDYTFQCQWCENATSNILPQKE